MATARSNVRQRVRRVDFQGGETKYAVVPGQRNVLAAGSGTSGGIGAKDAIYEANIADYTTGNEPPDGVRYWRDPWGMVHLSGGCKWTGAAGTMGTGTDLLRLPWEYRPLYVVKFPIACNQTAGALNLGVVQVNSTGLITILSYTLKAAAELNMDLSSVHFYADKLET